LVVKFKPLMEAVPVPDPLRVITIEYMITESSPGQIFAAGTAGFAGDDNVYVHAALTVEGNKTVTANNAMANALPAADVRRAA
jgi:hypothetical protein